MMYALVVVGKSIKNVMGNNMNTIKNLLKTPYIVFGIFMTFVLGIGLWYWQTVYIPLEASIVDFQSCHKAPGRNIIDTDPPQCVYNNKIFTQK